MIHRISLFVVALFGLNCAAHSQETPSNLALIADGKAKDEWYDGKPVSGRFIVGVRAISETATPDALSTAWVPVRFAGQKLCYSMLADQGRYEGLQQVRVASGWSGGAAFVPILTDYDTPPKALLTMNGNNALGLLIAGACTSDFVDLTVLPSNWKTSFFSRPIGIQVFLDAPRSDRLVAVVNNVQSNCERTQSDRGDYNFICLISSIQDTSSNVISIEILRYRPSVGRGGKLEMTRVRSIFFKVAL